MREAGSVAVPARALSVCVAANSFSCFAAVAPGVLDGVLSVGGATVVVGALGARMASAWFVCLVVEAAGEAPCGGDRRWAQAVLAGAMGGCRREERWPPGALASEGAADQQGRMCAVW